MGNVVEAIRGNNRERVDAANIEETVRQVDDPASLLSTPRLPQDENDLNGPPRRNFRVRHEAVCSCVGVYAGGRAACFTAVFLLIQVCCLCCVESRLNVILHGPVHAPSSSPV